MSSAAENDENQGVPQSGNQPNNSSENEGQDPRLVNVSEEEVVLEEYVPAEHPDTCQACPVKDDEIRLITNQFTEKEEMCHTLLQSLKAKQAKLESMKEDNDIYIKCRHELNHLRGLVQNVLNLGVPVNEHFGLDEIFMDKVRPSSTKPFSNPLAQIPPGTWGKMRSIQVESQETNHLHPQLVSSSNADYYVTKEYAAYRQQLGQFLDDKKLFQCAACLKPLYRQNQWILCMRCLAVPYCSTMCIHSHKPLHAIGCKTHHVWNAAIEAPKPTSTVDSNSISTSTSSSSSEGKGGKGKSKGKAKGHHDQRTSHKRQRTCWHYTNRGSCKDGDHCGDLHDDAARLHYLENERRRIQASLSTVAQPSSAYGNDGNADDGYGDAGGNDANW
jgi:hypothetical protein